MLILGLFHFVVLFLGLFHFVALFLGLFHRAVNCVLNLMTIKNGPNQNKSSLGSKLCSRHDEKVGGPQKQSNKMKKSGVPKNKTTK